MGLVERQAQPQRDTAEQMNTKTLARLAAWLLLVAIVFTTLAPIELRPMVSSSPNLERLCAFGLVGLAFGLAYPKHRFMLFLAILVGAGALEAAQNFTLTRHGRLPDFEIKGIGTALGVLVSCIPDRWVQQRPARPDHRQL